MNQERVLIPNSTNFFNRFASSWWRFYPLGVVSASLFGGFLLNEGVHLPSCPTKLITSLDCPGCGSTRASAALLRGDFSASLDHHLLVATAPLLVVLYYVLGKSFIPGFIRQRRSQALAYFFLTFAALRLLPFPPFEYLASDLS